MSEPNNNLFPASDGNEMDEEILSLIRRMNNDCDDDDISELDVDHIHNKAVDFARRQQYRRAVDTCVMGLDRFPANCDLLADIIKYASDAGNFGLAEEYVNRLDATIPRQCWNWRAFTFVFEFLVTQDVHGKADTCRELIAEYRRCYPYEEKSYMCEAELFSKLGKHAESMAILDEALHSIKHAPQCALRLADLQIEAGMYAEAIETANRGLAATETQASINIPYLMLVKTLSLDALLHDRAAKGERIDPDDIKKLVAMYDQLDEIPDIAPHSHMIQTRKACLKMLELSCQ